MRVFTKWRHNENYKSTSETNKKKNSFAPMPHTLIMSEAFLNLSYSSKVIYLYMTDYANGLETTTFPKSIYEKITTKQTFSNSIQELTEAGFIETIVFGKSTRTENWYQFKEDWKYKTLTPKKKREPNFNKKKE